MDILVGVGAFTIIMTVLSMGYEITMKYFNRGSKGD